MKIEFLSYKFKYPTKKYTTISFDPEDKDQEISFLKADTDGYYGPWNYTRIEKYEEEMPIGSGKIIYYIGFKYPVGEGLVGFFKKEDRDATFNELQDWMKRR